MKISVVSAALLLTFGAVQAIRVLKEGPMIDADGREYKLPPLGVEDEGRGGLAAAVHVYCTDTSMTVVMKPDPFKMGHPVSPGEFFLGKALDPRCQAVVTAVGEFEIEAGLQDCGSKLTVSKDSVTYSNQLIFSPPYGPRGLKRKTRITIPVSCHYKSGPQQVRTFSTPTQHHTFGLQLMTDDWLDERTSRVFYLGDFLHLQAHYTGPDPGQKQVFIDNCVATLSPDPRSVPRYYFIENHGCLVDTKQGGLDSRFQPRDKDHSLRLKLEVFLFKGDSRNSIFITCQLKVTSKNLESSLINKACNYENSRWENVDGNSDVCQCCNSTCSQAVNTGAKQRILSDILSCGSVSIGPLTVYPRK